MSFVKKHIADSFVRGLPMNEIIEQVSTLKRLRGKTCVDHGYRERLERYVRSEIERLKRKTRPGLMRLRGESSIDRQTCTSDKTYASGPAK
jgi:hypothetical protein